MKAILDTKPWANDLSLHQYPWRIPAPESLLANMTTPKLTIGVIWDDEIVRPSPPVNRALRQVVEKLKMVPGVNVALWKPFQHDVAMEILVSLGTLLHRNRIAN